MGAGARRRRSAAAVLAGGVRGFRCGSSAGRPARELGRVGYPSGAELFVLDGSFADEGGTFARGAWLRLPPGAVALAVDGRRLRAVYQGGRLRVLAGGLNERGSVMQTEYKLSAALADRRGGRGLRRPAGGELRRARRGRCGACGVRSVARSAESDDHDGAARRSRRRHTAPLLRARRDPARHRLSRAASVARKLERPVPEVRRRHEGRRSRLRRSSFGARLRRREQQHGSRRRLRARRVVRVRQPPGRDRLRLSRRASHGERRQEPSSRRTTSGRPRARISKAARRAGAKGSSRRSVSRTTSTASSPARPCSCIRS